MNRARRRVAVPVAGVVLAAVMALGGPAAAVAKPSAFEVQEYVRDFAASADEAEERLEAQSAGTEADIVGQLEGRLGSNYAGVWFDNRTGEFVVPILDNRDRDAVADAFASAGLRDKYRVSQADASWKDLQAAQADIGQELRLDKVDGLLRT